MLENDRKYISERGSGPLKFEFLKEKLFYKSFSYSSYSQRKIRLKYQLSLIIVESYDKCIKTTFYLKT